MWELELPYKISSNGTLTMKRSKMKEASDEWLLDLFQKTIGSALFGCGQLSKSTERSLILELKTRRLMR